MIAGVLHTEFNPA